MNGIIHEAVSELARPDGSIDVLKQGGVLGWRIAPNGMVTEWHQWEVANERL